MHKQSREGFVTPLLEAVPARAWFNKALLILMQLMGKESACRQGWFVLHS